MGHNASPEGKAELRQPNTRVLGSVAFLRERYSEDLIRVSLDILNRRAVPPAVFVEHKRITPGRVDHFYPNASLTQGDAIALPGAACQIDRAKPVPSRIATISRSALREALAGVDCDVHAGGVPAGGFSST
jgi:hypothetical protein